jgi:hypothetical protein
MHGKNSLGCTLRLCTLLLSINEGIVSEGVTYSLGSSQALGECSLPRHLKQDGYRKALPEGRWGA